MWLSEPIVLWMESNRLTALGEAIAAPDYFGCGADVQKFMQDKLNKLYRLKVSPEKRRSIEARYKRPKPENTSPAVSGGPCVNTLCRVSEKYGVYMLAVFNSFDLLDIARIADCYRRGDLALLKPSGFMELMGDFRIIEASDFAAAIDGKSWYGNKLAGVYNIDFNKSVLAVSNSLLDWTGYGLDDICAAARHACGGPAGDATDEMRAVFQEDLKHMEKRPYNPLESYTFRRN